MESVSKRLRGIRAIRKLTQLGVATRAGINPALYRQYECGDRNPKLPQLEKIASALMVNVAFLQPTYLHTTSAILAFLFDLIDSFYEDITFSMDDGNISIGIGKIDDPVAISELKSTFEAYSKLSINEFKEWLIDYPASDVYIRKELDRRYEDLRISALVREAFELNKHGDTFGVPSAVIDRYNQVFEEIQEITDRRETINLGEIPEGLPQVELITCKDLGKHYLEDTPEYFDEDYTQWTILRLMRLIPTISAKEIAKRIGTPQSKVVAHIRSLKKAGVVEHIGKARGGHWVVKEPCE